MTFLTNSFCSISCRLNADATVPNLSGITVEKIFGSVPVAAPKPAAAVAPRSYGLNKAPKRYVTSVCVCACVYVCVCVCVPVCVTVCVCRILFFPLSSTPLPYRLCQPCDDEHNCQATVYNIFLHIYIPITCYFYILIFVYSYCCGHN